MSRQVRLEVVFPKEQIRKKKQLPKTKAYLVLEFRGQETRILKGYLNKEQAEEHMIGLAKKEDCDNVSYGVIKVSLQGKRV